MDPIHIILGAAFPLFFTAIGCFVLSLISIFGAFPAITLDLQGLVLQDMARHLKL